MTPSHEPRADAALYRRLLDLDGDDELCHVIPDVLRRLARVVSADLAYVEVSSARRPLRLAHPPSAADGAPARTQIAVELLDQVIASGELLSSPHAARDPRFRELASVCAREIGAAICAPLSGVAGALYVQRAAPFAIDDLDHVQLCARHLGAALRRHATPAEQLDLHEATRQFQRRCVLAALERTSWNMSASATRLGIARSYLYTLVRTLHISRDQA